MDEHGLTKSPIITGETDHTTSSQMEQIVTTCDLIRLVDSQEAVRDNTPPFLKTPLEIRNQIYEYLLSTKRTKIDRESGPDKIYRPNECRPHYRFHPAIIAANRQISREASQVLHNNLLVKLTTDDIASFLPLQCSRLSLKRNESCITDYAIQLTLTVNTYPISNNLSVFLFLADEISTICKLLKRKCSGASISIMITGVARTTTNILRLLEPFRCLRGLDSVEISGQISDEYKSMLIAKMIERVPRVNIVLQDIQDSMEESDQAASIRDYPKAIAKYKRALEVSIDNVYADSKYDPVIKNGRFSGRSLRNAFFWTQRELELKLGVTYLKMKKYQRAHEWLMFQISDEMFYFCGGIPTFLDRHSAELANCYFLAAQASEGLGEMSRAIQEMKEAVRHDDTSGILARELARLESKMKHGDRGS